MDDFDRILAIRAPAETQQMWMEQELRKIASAGTVHAIRELREEDVPQVVQIENRSFTKEAYPEEVFREWLRHGLSGRVITVGEKVAAYLLDRDDDRDVGFRLGQSLAVAPEYRRCGFGETLMRDMLGRHEKVSADVDTTNTASKGMLKKLGFVTVRTFKEHDRRAHRMHRDATEKVALSLSELKTQSGKTDTSPTEAQKEEGNYRKGRVKWKGLTLAIENPKGTVRSGKAKDGTEWSVVMKSTYGYIVGQRSKADGDNVDVFLNDDHLDSELLFIVDQVKASGEFDEHKVLAGWIDIESAKAGYLANYSKEWTGLGDITPITLPQFKDWLEHGDTKKPYAGTSRHDKDAGVRDLAGYEDALCLPVGYQLQGLRSKGHPSLQKVAGELRGVPGGHGTVSAQADARTEGHDQGLHADELSVGDRQGAGEEQTDKSAADSRREDAHADRVVRNKKTEANDRTHEDREGYVGGKGANDGGEVESDEEFWKRNEAEKEARKDHKLGHIRDGYILCDGCSFRYHAMPADEMCPKCGTHIRTRLRSMTKKANSGFDEYEPHLVLVKRGADDGGHPFTVCVDLDGTLAEKEEPFDPDSIGRPIERAVGWVRRFHKNGARIIIFTVRGDKDLVTDWLDEHEVPYDFVNENPDQPPRSSGKVFADVYWDDRAFNAEDPDEHGPEILRRVKAHGGDDEDTKESGGMTVTVSRQTVVTITAPFLAKALGENDDEEEDVDGAGEGET